MRRGDYPTGDSDGVKRATDEALKKALTVKTRNHFQNRALILFAKDTWLRVSDITALKCGDIPQQITRGICPIQWIFYNISFTHFHNRVAPAFAGRSA